LKQGPRNWNLLITEFVIRDISKGGMGYTQCKSDPCLFYRRSESGCLMMLWMFVDDFQSFYFKQDTAEWRAIEANFVAEFEAKKMGPSTWILGMEIIRDRVKRSITVNQELYFATALEIYDLVECRTEKTPEAPTPRGEPIDDDRDGGGKPTDRQSYMELVGTLLYASISTRPDIAHAVNKLARHMQEPLVRHMHAAKRVLRYLAGTRNYGLKFGGHGNGSNAPLVAANMSGISDVVSAYSDADWANDKMDRKSISGWVVKLYGDVICWSSKKQDSVSQSSCEAEIYAAASVMNEVKWLRDLLSELGVLDNDGKGVLESSSLINCDNQSAIETAQNGIKDGRLKHVDIKYCVVTDYIKKGAMHLKWVGTDVQQADIFTKALGPQIFNKFRDQLVFPVRSILSKSESKLESSKKKEEIKA